MSDDVTLLCAATIFNLKAGTRPGAVVSVRCGRRDAGGNGRRRWLVDAGCEPGGRGAHRRRHRVGARLRMGGWSMIDEVFLHDLLPKGEHVRVVDVDVGAEPIDIW